MSEGALVEFIERGAITVGEVHAGSVLDALNVSQFGQEVVTYVKQRQGVRLLLDFHRVEYLSSAVLTELLRINQTCKEVGGDLRLCALNDDIRKVFEITNLDKMFTIYGEHDDAILKYARALSIEAQEDAWSNVQRDA
ncbi:MAG TPA: STAS domain-containing protein [Candidatus Hydrogenedentes bacterium]|nr:STAS domain-containing protein [Candidatus Hydrogenedentota bacterium]HRK34492.1 STAS domain-containing protein [Candidatus Hydrogenedentota bacterium]